MNSFGIYTGIQCQNPPIKKFKPQRHQSRVKKYFISSDQKGLLLMHQLGSGKTCTSFIIADALLDMESSVKTVYILSPGSLRQGWKTEYCDRCGAHGLDPMFKNFVFVTYNYNVVPHLAKSFDNSLVIIDEVHNLINGVVNNTKTARTIYKMLQNSDCKILALSGTPIYDKIYEWPILGNLLKPGAFPDILTSTGVDKQLFMDEFIITEDHEIVPKKPRAFKAALKGIISYFGGSSKLDYPRVIYKPIMTCIMSDAQAAKVMEMQRAENKIIAQGMPRPGVPDYHHKRIMYTLSAKRILSRQVSNFLYPKSAYITANEKKPDVAEPTGWVDRNVFARPMDFIKHSTKMGMLVANVLNHPNAKHMIFTFFKEQSGGLLIKTVLEQAGRRCEMFSGDLTDVQRERLLLQYNSVDNRYGQVIPVIIVTHAGSEGISLLETGHIHIFESDARENKIDQAIGRAIRYRSHFNMPLSEQVVRVWRYWSIFPEKEIYKDKKPIDQELYEKGQIKLKILKSFNDYLKNASTPKFRVK